MPFASHQKKLTAGDDAPSGGEFGSESGGEFRDTMPLARSIISPQAALGQLVAARQYAK